MFLFVILVVLIILSIRFNRSYNQYASGLRERPNYIRWAFSHYMNFKGWSTEEYCLSTKHVKLDEAPGYLSDKDIPRRNQPRPTMFRGLPHRQLTQQAPDEVMYEMYKYMESISIPRYGGQTLDDKLLLRGSSLHEYTGAEGLFIPNAKQNTFEKGELGHIHSNDGSFHMILHPSDGKLLIEKQWAERFPLAGNNVFHRAIPPTYVLIYAPQNEDELKTWKKILHAAIDYNRIIQKIC